MNIGPIATVLMVLLHASATAKCPANQPQNPEAAKHICQLINSLPLHSHLRRFMEEGAHGTLGHSKWMDTMKANGIKKALFEVHFVWHGRPQQMKVVRSIYFGEYDDPNSQIVDAKMLESLAKDGLEVQLQQVVLEQTSKGSWFFERPQHEEGLAGVSYVKLYDDEWIPNEPPRVQPLVPGLSELVLAVILGDKLSVEKLLSTGRFDQSEIQTALWNTISGPDETTDIVRRLVAAGGDVNAHSVAFPSPLRLAVEGDKLLTVKLLVRLGADPNLPDRDSRTPLTVAKQNHFSEIVGVLTQARTQKHKLVTHSVRTGPSQTNSPHN